MTDKERLARQLGHALRVAREAEEAIESQRKRLARLSA